MRQRLLKPYNFRKRQMDLDLAIPVAKSAIRKAWPYKLPTWIDKEDLLHDAIAAILKSRLTKPSWGVVAYHAVIDIMRSALQHNHTNKQTYARGETIEQQWIEHELFTVLNAHNRTPEEICVWNDLLEKSFDLLSAHRRYIVHELLAGRTLEDIGEELGITGSAACYAKRRSLEKIERRLY